MAQFLQHSVFDDPDRLPGCMGLLQPYFSDLGGIVQSSLREYTRLFGDRDQRLDASSKATVRHDAMEHYAEFFAEESDSWVHTQPYVQSSYSTYQGRVLVRYKKLDDNLRPRNVLTKAQANILDGQLSLFGDQVMHDVIVGYQLAKTGIPRNIVIVERSGREVVWFEEFQTEDVSLTDWIGLAPPFAPGILPNDGGNDDPGPIIRLK